MDFLNSENLQKSFDENEVVNFDLMDVAGRRENIADHVGYEKRKHFLRRAKIAFFKINMIFYAVLILVSVGIGIASLDIRVKQPETLNISACTDHDPKKG